MIFLYIIAGLAVLCLIDCFTEIHLLKIKYYQADNTAVSSDFNKKIIMLSDLHGCSFGKSNKRLVRRLASLRPDIVLISGDMITVNSEKEMNTAISLLRDLKAMNIEIYYSPGNHEKRLEELYPDIYAEYIAKAESYAVILDNTGINLSDRLCLYGLNPPTSYYRKKYLPELSMRDYIKETFEKTDDKCYNILLAHDPYYFEQYSECGFDLVLSGHVHGGIIRLPVVGGVISPRVELFPKYDKGLFEYKDSRMIVSGGLGWHALPFRFLNPPEIIVLKLS